MSRTYRRKKFGYGKNKRAYPEWVLIKSFEPEENYSCDEKVKKLNEFHSDNIEYCVNKWHVPKWFKKDVERKKRHNSKQRLNYLINKIDEEDFVFEDCFKDIDWLYW